VKNKNIECEKYEKIKISRATNTKEKKYGGWKMWKNKNIVDERIEISRVKNTKK
jgi:hypothetical protein